MTHTAPPADAIAAVTHPNPYPWYASLRNGPSLVFDERLHLWIASRADVVREILANDRLRVRPPAEPVPRAIADAPAGEVFGKLVRMNDGGPHTTHRPVLQRALASLDLAEAREVALRAAEGVPEGPLTDTCIALPIRAVAHLLGFSHALLPQVTAWTRDFVACISPLSTTQQLEAASTAAVELMGRFEVMATHPAREGSLLAAVQAEAPGDTSRTLLANLVGLLSQTCDATAGLLGNGLVALAREPGLRRKIGTRMELLDLLVDEMARHDPSTQNTRRFVAAPTTAAGFELAPGEAILLVLGAANRDTSLNPAPATFELMRAERRTLGFGHGAHVCPGQALAATLAAAGIEVLLTGGLDTDALLERGWDYRPSVNTRIPVFH